MHHKGRTIKGRWIFGGVETLHKNKCFFVHVDDRTFKTLSEIIFEYVLPGSMIITDGWRILWIR